MAVIYNHGDSVDHEKASVALGTFDGVHIAHMEIIQKAKEMASESKIKCGILTFDSIPANVISDVPVPQLMTLSDRIEQLPAVDFVFVEKFDKDFMSMSPEEFVLYLKNKINASSVSVGYNYRFGKRGAGDAHTLKSLCEKENIQVYISNESKFNGSPISSTRIRGLVIAGEVEEAAKLLGRPFFIKGVVCQGLQNGQKMGVPTANIIPYPQIVCPKHGVYAGFCTIDKNTYKSVINVGNNPTFKGEKTTIECHLLDYSGDLYNKNMTVEFIKYIRDEINFNAPEALVEQISKDIEFAKKTFKLTAHFGG